MALRKAKIKIDNHASDLYFVQSKQSMRILDQYPAAKKSANRFHGTDNQQWIEVPFAYDPWWEARCA
jgi:hypothetical protein